jgi:hypothetical protein
LTCEERPRTLRSAPEPTHRNSRSAIQRRLDLFLGSENYDNRIDNGGLFDLEVLADLRLRYGNKADGLAPGQRAR